MSAISSGQEQALKLVLLNYANDSQTTSYEAIKSITTILGCDGEETLRDQFAMAALNGYLSTHESWFRTTDEHRGNITARAYLWADAMMKARTA